MLRKTVMAVALVAATGTVAAAQEAGTIAAPGAQGIEVSVAPVGGIWFAQPSNTLAPKFSDYNLGGSITGNVNKWIGIEGDVAYAVGARQDLAFSSVSLLNQKTPNLLEYSGNVMYNPLGSDRAIAPYVVGGVGAMTMFNTAGAANLGLTLVVCFLAGLLGLAAARALVGP